MNLNLQNNKMKGMNATKLHNIPELLHSSLSGHIAWQQNGKQDRSMSPSSTASANTGSDPVFLACEAFQIYSISSQNDWI